MKRLNLVILGLLAVFVVQGQNVMNVEAVHTVSTTIYDDGIGNTAIKDVTGVFSAIAENTGAQYQVTITSLDNVAVQTVLYTGISTTSHTLLPITVSTSLFDLDTTTWELFTVVYPNGQRELAQVVVISENGVWLAESPAGCESSTKFFGDDGTFQFQNHGTTFVNTSNGSVLRMACADIGYQFCDLQVARVSIIQRILAVRQCYQIHLL